MKHDKVARRTVMNCPPESIWLMDFEIEGFSATQRTRIKKSSKKSEYINLAARKHSEQRIKSPSYLQIREGT
jgi:hypothetical protein